MKFLPIIFLLLLPGILKSQSAFIQIDTDPGIAVYLDDSLVGETASKTGKLLLSDIDEGMHHISFKIYDFELKDSVLVKDSTLSHLDVNIIKGSVNKNSPFNRELNKTSYSKNFSSTSYGTFVDERDNTIYKTVEINGQVWMAENLIYNYGLGCHFYGSSSKMGRIYGRLYDWQTAMISCPSGWHLPNENDWAMLEEYLGMEKKHIMSRGWRNIEMNGALKAGSGWNSDGNGENLTGFSCLPGGYRDIDGVFYNEGEYSYFWVGSDIDKEEAWYRVLTYDIDNIGRFKYSKKYGFSVRCIRNNDK